MTDSRAPYDPDARRDTPLALKLKARIRAAGPLTVHAYMDACLHDPEHGYYRVRPVLGRGGDFVTAPEISQVFGELIGLWSVVVWQQMGRPSPIRLVELGPGRGTLMKDALRATSRVPDFTAALRIHLVETSPTLIAMQRETLAPLATTWHDALSDVPDGAAIFLANEFLDALPVVQTCSPPNAAGPGTTVRRVGLDSRDRLVYEPTEGAIFESQAFPDVDALRARRGPTAGLFIDYGDARDNNRPGDSLQAVRDHRFEHVLTSPGEADLSVQVDFGALARVLGGHALVTDGPTTQAEFLGSLGIMERASRLIAANPTRANAIETGVARLMAPNGMGTRFKVLGMRSQGLPPLPGFPTPAAP